MDREAIAVTNDLRIMVEIPVEWDTNVIRFLTNDTTSTNVVFGNGVIVRARQIEQAWPPADYGPGMAGLALCFFIVTIIAALWPEKRKR